MKKDNKEDSSLKQNWRRIDFLRRISETTPADTETTTESDKRKRRVNAWKGRSSTAAPHTGGLSNYVSSLAASPHNRNFLASPLRSAPTRLLRRASSLNYSIPIHFPIYFHGSFLDRNWMVLLGWDCFPFQSQVYAYGKYEICTHLKQPLGEMGVSEAVGD